jgi:hypothetical protein
MLLQSPLRVENRCPRLWSLAAAAGLLGVAVFASGIGLRAADADSTDTRPLISAAAPDDQAPARKEDPNAQPRNRSDRIEGLEENLNKAIEDLTKRLQDLPTEVDADKIRKQVDQALEKVQHRLQELQARQADWQRLPRVTVGQSRARTGRLGVAVETPNAALSEQLDLPKGQGLVITQVTPDSAASKAGLKANDILLEVNGKAVPDNVQELQKMLRDIKANSPIDVVVLRRGRKETVKGLSLPEAAEERRPGRGFGERFPEPPATPRQPSGPSGAFTSKTPFFPGVPGVAGAMAGVATGGNTVMTTMFRSNDAFTTRHQEGSLIITLTGSVAEGKARVNEIHVQDGGQGHKYESLDKVPQRYRDKVRNLVDMCEKGSVRIEIKSPRP